VSVRAAVSLVTLGVADVSRSEAFYASLGWEVAVTAEDGLRVFRTQGAWLALYPRDSLAADAGVAPGSGQGFRDVALALNLDSPKEVDKAFELALKAGGSTLSSPEQKSWGGYSGYISDPDGHAWEVAYNPLWPNGSDGRPVIS
jgi:uncharacterized protein